MESKQARIFTTKGVEVNNYESSALGGHCRSVVVLTADKLPTVIIRIVCDEEDRL